MKSYEEVAESVFRRGDEIIKRNKRRRRVMLGVCTSAVCLAAVIAVSLGEWAASRRKIDPVWSPSDSGLVTDPEAPEITGQNASDSGDPVSYNSVNIINDPIIFVSETEATADSEPTAATSDRMPEEGKLLWPVGGEDGGVIIEMMDGYGGYTGHKGIDIQASRGTPVYAAADGYVVDADDDGNYNSGRGSYVVIEHDDGYATSYCHMSTVSVCSGQRVTAGETIGEIGSSGEIYGECLHFEVRTGVDGTPLNPIDFLPPHKYAHSLDEGMVGVVSDGELLSGQGTGKKFEFYGNEYYEFPAACYFVIDNGKTVQAPYEEGVPSIADKLPDAIDKLFSLEYLGITPLGENLYRYDDYILAVLNAADSMKHDTFFKDSGYDESQFFVAYFYVHYNDDGTVGVIPDGGTPIQITTVIDDFGTDADTNYDIPENGSVMHSIPLDGALEYYGDKDENGNDIQYYIEVHFFKDGERVDAGDLIIREDEWNRISATGVQCEFMTSSEDWGETHTHYFLLMLTKEEVESFVPSDDLGYMFYLVDEDGEGPVHINRDVIHLPADIISEDTPDQ